MTKKGRQLEKPRTVEDGVWTPDSVDDEVAAGLFDEEQLHHTAHAALEMMISDWLFIGASALLQIASPGEAALACLVINSAWAFVAIRVSHRRVLERIREIEGEEKANEVEANGRWFW